MIDNNQKLCCYCGGCVAVCPVNAITLDETKIVIDNEKCINCGACIRICPVMAMEKKE
ncbi:MAG: 4Fe-4S binding protein [Candidatus Diapherotrites archaeon]